MVNCFIIITNFIAAEFLGSMDHSLNVTMVNQLLRSDDVTVTLHWPREPGAVYHISVSPEVSYTEHACSMGHYIFAINLTISYNVQYNVSIESSPCGVTTSRILKYGKISNNNIMWTVECLIVNNHLIRSGLGIHVHDNLY